MFWYKKLHDVLLDKINYRQLRTDSAKFFKKRNTGPLVILLVYVDDYIFGPNDMTEVKAKIATFLERFEEAEEPLERNVNTQLSIREELRGSPKWPTWKKS